MAKKSWLERFLTPDADRAERREPDQFFAYRWADTAMKSEPVRDISSTGVYVVTPDRWPVGSVLALTMQKQGPLEVSPERRITALARVARIGNHGVGFSFIVPQDDNERIWKSILDSFVQQMLAKDMAGLVRMAQAVATLSQICPEGAESINELIGKRLSNHRVGNASTIALHAEAILAAAETHSARRCHPALLVRILEDGSITDEDWLQQLWGGLIASSCSSSGADISAMPYIEIFSQLTPVPARILTIVAAVSSKYLNEAGDLAARPLACTAEELGTAAGSRGTQTERELERLVALGLLERKDASSSKPDQPADILIAPTTLGLELFARCNGHQGPLNAFYTLDQPVTPVRLKQQ